MHNKKQLERIAMQLEMLKLAKPMTTITNEEFQHITIRALDMIKILKLDDNLDMPDEWVKRDLT